MILLIFKSDTGQTDSIRLEKTSNLSAKFLSRSLVVRTYWLLR